MNNPLHDGRYGLRRPRKNPAFTVIAVLALSVGIVVNTAIYSVAEILLIKPVSFPALDRLVKLVDLQPNQPLRLNPPDPMYEDECQSFAVREAAPQRLEPATRLQATTGVTCDPSGHFLNSNTFSIEGQVARDTVEFQVAIVQSVSPGFFRMMRIPLLEGREFSDSDGADSRRVTIISRRLAQMYFPGENPLGRRIKVGLPESGNPWMTIVGVVEDIRYSPFSRNLDPAIYRPHTQVPRSYSYFVMSTTPGLPIRGPAD